MKSPQNWCLGHLRAQKCCTDLFVSRSFGLVSGQAQKPHLKTPGRKQTSGVLTVLDKCIRYDHLYKSVVKDRSPLELLTQIESVQSSYLQIISQKPSLTQSRSECVHMAEAATSAGTAHNSSTTLQHTHTHIHTHTHTSGLRDSGR